MALRGAVRRAAGGGRRRAPRDPLGRGLARRGHRHRPHRAGLRPRGLRARAQERAAGAHAGRRGRPLLRQLRLAARPLDHRRQRADHRLPRGARAAGRVGPVRAPLPRVLALPNAAHLPHRRRLVHQRQGHPPAEARRERRGGVDAGVLRQAHGRLAREHGRLEHLAPPLLRAAAAVLPVRVRPPERDRLTGGARGARGLRPRTAAGAPPAVDRSRPGHVLRVRRDRRADRRGRRCVARRRNRPVVDARLGEPGARRGRLWPRRREGPHGRRPARPRLLGEVVPGRPRLRDARADPALVLLPALHVGGARRKGAVPLGARLREDARRGRPRDARLVGQHDRRQEAFERMGSDVMRWQFCAQPPDRNLLFGYGAAGEIKRKLLTLWNSAKFLIDYANIEGFEPRFADLDGGPDCELSGLDRWLLERTSELVEQCTGGLEDRLTHQVMRAFDSYVEDLSNWYIRRSRRRFYSYDEAAFRSLWTALVQALRVISPVMPFLSDHLWRRLVAGACEGAPPSVHLAGWPEAREPNRELLDSVAEVRRVVELGRSARNQAKLTLRQPLRRLVVQGARGISDYTDEIAGELRVKEVELGEIDAMELRVKPNLPVLGPRLGRELGPVRAALAEGRFEQLDGGGFRVDGHELGEDDVLVERTAREGWSLAGSDGLTVAIDTTLDEELRREGRVLDLVHEVNGLRKVAGLEITDRIKLTLPRVYEELREYESRIADETLAVEVTYADVDRPRVEKA